MARRKLTNKLIDKSEIKEEMRLITGSETDYITPSGEVYKDYGNNKFYHKAQWLNWGYWYTGITYPDGPKQKRVHRLVAEAYIPNPNNYPYVLHLDDNKANKHVSNLAWGTPSENTQDAVDKMLIVNDKGWDDSQSIPVCAFTLQGDLIEKFLDKENFIGYFEVSSKTNKNVDESVDFMVNYVYKKDKKYLYEYYI